MLKLVKYFLWLIVLVALTIGFDRFMVVVPLNAPGLKQTQQFYVDFRARLLQLAPMRDKTAPPVDVIKAVIEKKTATAVKEIKKKGQRYLYVDGSGTLQFADSLQQVPKKYRHEAQPLAE